MLKEKAPKLFKYLTQELNKLQESVFIKKQREF